MEEVKRFGRNRVALEYRYSPRHYSNDFLRFLHKEVKTVIKRHFAQLPRKTAWKISLEACVTLEKIENNPIGSSSNLSPVHKSDLTVTTIDPWFRSSTITIYSRRDLDESLEDAFNEILRTYENFVRQGSGFFFRRVEDFRMTMARFIPLSGGRNIGGAAYRALPAQIRRKRSVFRLLNQRDENMCFMDCIRTAHATRNGLKATTNEFDMRNACSETIFDTGGLTYPTPIRQIKKFEEKNNLSINVFGLKDLELFHGRKRKTSQSPIYVIYHSKNEDAILSDSGGVVVESLMKVDLLHFKNHYFLITDLARLIGFATPNRAHICRSCLTVHSTKKSLSTHTKFCDRRGLVYSLPRGEQSIVKFEKFESLVPRSFSLYFDIETAACPISSSGIKTVKRGRKKTSHRKLLSEHKPIAVGAIRICHSNAEYNSELFIHVGHDCIEQFLNWLDVQSSEMQHIFESVNHPAQKTETAWKKFMDQTHCEMCRKRFTKKTQKHFDHCHLSGAYRSALCLGCNLSRAKNTVLDTPVFAHVNAKFDSSFLVRPMAERIRDIPGRFRVLNKSKENNFVLFYRSFVFKDSFQWLPSSLAELISLKVAEDSPERRSFPLLFDYVNEAPDDYKLLCQKQYFPYELVTSLDVLRRNGLPSRRDFHDSLRDKDITTQEYEHAQIVFQRFDCSNLEDFLTVYLTVDVLALADIFESYRRIAIKSFSIDPIYFLSGAHYSFHAMLHYTNVRIELLRDIDMHNFIARSIRGGLTYIATRYMEANIPTMKNYDASRPNFEMTYLDCSAMYSHALTKPLPLKNFRWLKRERVNNIDISQSCGLSLPGMDSGFAGYILEVDVSFPRHLHDFFKEFPPMPEQWIPDITMWSDYQRKLARKTGQNCKRLTKKLINHLGPRKNYVVHIELLNVCLKLGVQLDKIHRVLRFEQSRWVKPYIDVLMLKRKESKSAFESNYFKKNSNSIFGYLTQDCTKRLKTNFVTNSKNFLRYSRKPNFKNCTVFSRHLALLELKPQEVRLTTPITAGFTVLELSKAHMIAFWYNFLKKTYGDDLVLGFSDTDSFLIGLRDCEPNSMQKTMWAHRRYFDMSNMPPPYQSFTNARRPGTFKCEFSGRHTIAAFCGLRAKSYCILLDNDVIERKSKGIPKHVLSRVQFEDYRRALFDPVPLEDNHFHFQAIRSLKQVKYTARERRKGLSAFDDKRVVDSNGINTLPYFHYAVVTGAVHGEQTMYMETSL